MRHVVYMLVVVNLVFLGWNIFQSQTAMQLERDSPALSETAVPLVTLQEKEQAAADEISVIDAITSNEPPGAGAGLVCQTLGPFFARDVMQATEAKLAAMGMEPQQRESERKHPIGYWVYLPEMERGESLRLAQILDDHSDKEYFIGKGNIISLGAFKEMSRARIRLNPLPDFFRVLAGFPGRILDGRTVDRTGGRHTGCLVAGQGVLLNCGTADNSLE